MTIHTQIYTGYGETPKEGMFLYRDKGGNLDCWDGSRYVGCIPPITEPFLLALLGLAKRGERCRCKEVYSEEEAEAILFPNSSLVAQAIRDGCAGIVEAMMAHAEMVTDKRASDAFDKIAEKVRGG